jgi:hypothetical protein
LDKRTIGLAAGGAAVLLLLVSGAVWWLRKRKEQRVVVATGPAELPAGVAAPTSTLPARTGSAEVAAADSMEDEFQAKIAEREALERKMEAQALSSLKLAPVITKTAEVLAKHLREKITKDPEVSAQVLRTWIREEEA